jgi:hypothetical protein
VQTLCKPWANDRGPNNYGAPREATLDSAIVAFLSGIPASVGHLVARLDSAQSRAARFSAQQVDV